MDKDQKRFIDQSIGWIKNQQIIIRQTKSTMKYNQEMIDTHTEALDLGEKTLEIESNATNDYIEEIKQWMNEKGIQSDEFNNLIK